MLHSGHASIGSDARSPQTTSRGQTRPRLDGLDPLAHACEKGALARANAASFWRSFARAGFDTRRSVVEAARDSNAEVDMHPVAGVRR